MLAIYIYIYTHVHIAGRPRGVGVLRPDHVVDDDGYDLASARLL